MAKPKKKAASKKAASKKKAAARKPAPKKKAAARKPAPRAEAEAEAEAEASTTLAKTGNGTSALVGVDPLMADSMGTGHEEVSSDDMSSPFLQVLQPQSPSVVPASDMYDEEASPGDFLHTVSRELWGGEDGILIVPAHFIKRWIEWIPRSMGGGFIRQYDAGEVPSAAISGDINILVDEEGNLWELPEKKSPRQCVLTHIHYVVVITEKGPEPVVFSCSGTQLTPSSKWNSLSMAQRANGNTLPRFSTVYRLTTSMRTNEQGSWYVFAAGIERRLAPSDNADDYELFMCAKGFHAAAREGGVEVAHKQEGASGQPAEPAPEHESGSEFDDLFEDESGKHF